MKERTLNIINVENLSRKFGNFTAVDDVSFAIPGGEIFGLLGANGAGKTTLIRVLTGLLSASSGNAFVAGFNVNKNPDGVKRNIGYMSQRFSLYEDLTVKENIQLFGGIYGVKPADIRTKTTDLLERLELKNMANTLVRSMPLGWRQKLAFSVAIFHNPRVVFLDEPTSGVDPVARRQFWEMIYSTAEIGITVLVTTHYMDEASYCDRIAIMHNGKLEACGSPSELKGHYSATSIDEVFLKIAR
jgi:ABC-2 type transport system ATP-binding protein